MGLRSSVLAARDAANLAVGVKSDPASRRLDGLTDWERARYSVVKVIRHLAGDTDVDVGLEIEVSDAIASRLQTKPKGLYVPSCIRAGLDTKTGGAGGYTVATDVRDLIELLRNRSRLIQLGATLLSGLDSNVAFPVEITGSTGSWIGENSGTDVADSDGSFGQRGMSPKTYEVTTSFSRKLLAQSSIDVEKFVRADLARAHAVAIDQAGINGSGESNQPLGILGTSGIGDVTIGANGGAPTHAVLADLESKVADANADEGDMAFLTTPTMRSKLRKTQEFGTTGEPAWQQLGNSLGVGDVLGYPGRVSRNVPSNLVKGSSSDCHAIIFGAWPELIIGEWGVLEIFVDPFRLKKQNMLEVTSYQLADILVRQPGAFAASKDARNV
jgi:HK97 family phage major capsid protein